MYVNILVLQLSKSTSFILFWSLYIIGSLLLVPYSPKYKIKIGGYYTIYIPQIYIKDSKQISSVHIFVDLVWFNFKTNFSIN